MVSIVAVRTVTKNGAPRELGVGPGVVAGEAVTRWYVFDRDPAAAAWSAVCGPFPTRGDAEEWILGIPSA